MTKQCFINVNYTQSKRKAACFCTNGYLRLFYEHISHDLRFERFIIQVHLLIFKLYFQIFKLNFQIFKLLKLKSIFNIQFSASTLENITYKSCYYSFILLPAKRFVIFTCRYFKLSRNPTAWLHERLLYWNPAYLVVFTGWADHDRWMYSRLTLLNFST